MIITTMIEIQLFVVVVLGLIPGGMPGAESLRDSVELKELSLRQEKDNKLIGKMLMSMMIMSTMMMIMMSNEL